MGRRRAQTNRLKPPYQVDYPERTDLTQDRKDVGVIGGGQAGLTMRKSLRHHTLEGKQSYDREII